MTKIEDINLLFNCLNMFDTSTSVTISERVGNLKLYAEKLMQNAHNYYVEQDTQIVGFISYYANKFPTTYIAVIAVKETYKIRGIGSKMLHSSMHTMKILGFENVQLEVHKENHQAIAFYKKNEFVIKCREHGNYFLMVKELHNV